MHAKKKNTSVLLLVVLGCLLVAPRARAEHSASVRLANTFVQDPAFAAVSADSSMVQAEFNYALRILGPLWRGRLWVDGSFLLGSLSTDIFSDRFNVNAVNYQFMLGTRYTIAVTSWFVPMARIGAGVSVGSLTMESSAETVEDWAPAFVGHALAGFELLMPRIWIFQRFTVGLVVEGGYSFCTDLTFEQSPAVDEDLRLMPVQGVSLGTLNYSGPQLRVGLVVRF